MAVGPLLFLLAVSPGRAGLVAVLLLLGIATQLKQPAVQSLLVEAVPPGRRTTLVGLYFFFTSEGRSLMVPLIAFLMDALELRATFAGLSLVAVAFSVAAFALRKRA